MNKFANLARVTTATVGTGTVTLGAAVAGYKTFADAGLADGAIITYGLREGSNSEIGIGTYNSAGPTVSRDTVIRSTNADAKINLGGNAQIFTTAAAEDFDLTVNLQTGTTYTVLQTDRQKMICLTNAAAIAVTLPQATGHFGAGWSTLLKNVGSSKVTITPTTSTIGGASAITLEKGQTVKVISDGTNYYIIKAGGTGFYVQASAPTPAEVGDRWLDSDTGILYTYVPDGDSLQWVDLNSGDGFGDLLSTNNFSDVADVETARLNIGAVPLSLQNVGLSVSAAANALTIALKGADGNDPSTSNAVYIPFRSATLTNGGITTRKITSALSLVLSSGSTLGVLNNGPTGAGSTAVAFSIWIVAFDDAGTIRLGAIQTVTGGSIPSVIASVNEYGVASSTAEGGAGGADSAGTFYTGSAVTSKPYRVLGVLTYASGLTTAGTWDAAPTTVQVFTPGMKLPGDVAQIRYAKILSTTSTTSATFVTTTMTDSISLTNAANVALVEMYGVMALGGAQTMEVGMGQGGTTNIFGGLGRLVGGAQVFSMSALTGMIKPSTTALTTYYGLLRSGTAGQTNYYPYVTGDIVANMTITEIVT